MALRQNSNRCLCSELVEVGWVDAFGRRRKQVANLGEIWQKGAVLESESPIRTGSEVQIRCRGAAFIGKVTRCSSDFVGYLLEVEFAPGVEWRRELYEPEHFFDPSRLNSPAARHKLASKNCEMIDDCIRNLPSSPRS